MNDDAAERVEADLGKRREEIMSKTVRESVSIQRGYFDRKEQEQGAVDCHQYPPGQDESVQLAIALIQGKWKIGILSSLQRGPVRLSQLRRMFPLASKKMLAQHLREMERDGLIIRTDLSGRLRHVEYSLSDLGGFAVLQLFNTLTEWGSRYALSLLRTKTIRGSSDDFASPDGKSSSSRLQKLQLGPL